MDDSTFYSKGGVADEDVGPSGHSGSNQGEYIIEDVEDDTYATADDIKLNGFYGDI